MREIKFRGLDESGNWVYGDLIQTKPNKVDGGFTCWIKPKCALGLGVISTPTKNFIKVDPETVGQMSVVDGREFYDGDKVRYWYVYADHSDACEMFGVEPQCNWSVHEIYADKREGVVSRVDGCLKVDGIPLSKIGDKFYSDLMDYHYHGIIEGGLREFVALANEMGLKSPMRENCKPIVVGNIYQNPELKEGP